MSTIEPVRQNIENPLQIKRHSGSIRLWHWVNALVICGSLLTVLLNATILDKRSNTELIQNKLQQDGTIISSNKAAALAHALEDKVWTVHIYLGYFLAGLLLFRILLEFFQLKDQKFLRGLNKAYQNFSGQGFKRRVARHDLTVKILYLVFYLLITIVVITGLSVGFGKDLGLTKSMRHSIKEVHGFCMYLIISFVLIHLVGVLLAERKDGKGIISDMVNGGEKT